MNFFKAQLVTALVAAIVAFLVTISGGFVNQEQAGKIANEIVEKVVQK